MGSRYIILVLFLIIVGAACLVCAVYIDTWQYKPINITSILEDNNFIKENIKVSDPKSCQGMDLYNSAYCLEYYVNSIYNYVPSIDNDSRTVGDIIKYGGDCYDYSLMYQFLSISLGYLAKPILISTEASYGHQFTVMYDSTGYCILDQTEEPVCKIYEK